MNYGHNNPLLKHSLVDYIQNDGITHSLDLHTSSKEAFLQTFDDIILKPRGLDYVAQFTGPTGTNAVEAALKIARKVTGRSNVIYFTNGFHGVSMGGLSVTGNKYLRHASGVSMGGTTPMPFDSYLGDDLDTLSYLDQVLNDPSSGVDEPAAIILETVQGEGGLNVASVAWLQRLQALCNERNIMLIVDDIQAGCGRTGTFFSFENAGLNPDIVTLSKSLSGYGLPFSVVLIKRSLDKWDPGEHNGTFRGNNHAFITSKAMLENYWADDTFAQSIAERSQYLEERLQTIVEQFPPHLGDVRGRGFMRGFHCADTQAAQAIAAKSFDKGLILERCGPLDEVVKCMMPLTTPMDLLVEGLDVLKEAVMDVLAADDLEISSGSRMNQAYSADSIQEIH